MHTILHLMLSEAGWELSEWGYRYFLQQGTWASLTDVTGNAPPSRANAPCVLRFYDRAGNTLVMCRCSTVATAMDVVVGAVVNP